MKGRILIKRFAGRIGLTLAAALTALVVTGVAQAYSVTVQIRGAGSVTGPGITCSSSITTPSSSFGQSGVCTADYGSFSTGTVLSASPLPGSSSIGWSFASWSPCPRAVTTSCGFGGLFDTGAYTVRANFSDSTAPSIALVAGPAAGSTVASSVAAFTVSTDDLTATFRCSIDSNPATDVCGATTVFSGLADGSHTFRARSVDPSGNSSTTLERTWIGNTAPPPPVVKCHVPGLRGKRLFQARTALQRAHCALGNVSRAYGNLRRGRILRQSPGAGATRPAGARVNVVVSRGHR
jgi:hypothetical protein